jgi:hypothetical protein
MTDLLIFWSWEHDADFLALLQAACQCRDISTQMIGPQELGNLTDDIRSGKLQARVVLDRVWDLGGEFTRHCDAVIESQMTPVNDYALVKRAWNKPTMHYEMIAHGISAPYMMVMPSYDTQPVPVELDLQRLGEQFSVKGAHSGGSGVLSSATTWNEVLKRRAEWPSDETTLQTWVEPQMMGKRRAWFRIFYACGTCYLCWADDLTHVQTQVSVIEESQYRLDQLRGMTQQIAGICGLNLFSTEIALDRHHIWQVVDYVNDPCDYRLKSKALNGVPDEVVKAIAERLAGWVKRRARRPFDTVISVR